MLRQCFGEVRLGRERLDILPLQLLDDLDEVFNDDFQTRKKRAEAMRSVWSTDGEVVGHCVVVSISYTCIILWQRNTYCVERRWKGRTQSFLPINPARCSRLQR